MLAIFKDALLYLIVAGAPPLHLFFCEEALDLMLGDKAAGGNGAMTTASITTSYLADWARECKSIGVCLRKNPLL
jgi:hypothetical protein